MILELDSAESLYLHRRRIRDNNFLRRLYEDFYLEIKNSGLPAGTVVELGSGPGFIKKIIPNTITSDVISGPDIDQTFSAAAMPFTSNSIGAFVMFNVFHHLKEPEQALREMERCLMPGGKIVMIERYNSVWGHFVYSHFHYEDFNPMAGWKIEGDGRLSDANNAMPWIVFVRDQAVFSKKFPLLNIMCLRVHTPFRFIISGGLTKPQLLPAFLYPAVCWFEKIISPFNKQLGMFVTIELQKRPSL